MQPAFKRFIGFALLTLGVLGATSLSMKEIPLALFGQRSTGIVNKVEKITTSSGSADEMRNGRRVGKKYGSDLTFMHIDFTTKDGKPVQVKTLATFHTEAKAGDVHPMIYMPSRPENAKIYSAKQLWLPMCVGFIFSGTCLFLGMRFTRRPPLVHGASASRGPTAVVEVS